MLTIKYFRFSKYIGNILSQLLPLILSILAYLFLLYLRGIVSPDIFKKLLFYSLVFFIAFFLLKWLFNTIFNLIDSLSRSKALNRMRIELWGLLIIILLLIPFGIYFFFKEDSSFIVNYCNSYLSYLTGVLLIILFLGVLFTARKKNKTGAAEIIMIVIYYFFFILFYLNIINIYVILAIELFGLLSIVLYSVRNSISFNTALALLIYLLIYLRMRSRTARAISSRMKTKVQTLPVISPCATKNVISSLTGIFPSRVQASHHGVEATIFPPGLMMALIPVFAHLAMARRVSIALRQA